MGTGVVNVWNDGLTWYRRTIRNLNFQKRTLVIDSMGRIGSLLLTLHQIWITTAR